MRTLRLGLIGGNITATRSPALHVLCGLSVGVNVTYDLLIPSEQGLDFPTLLTHCETLGFAGVNVTYPHKEQAAALVPQGSASVTRLGAANTVTFTPEGPRAHNTDHSGFLAAWAEAFGTQNPGRTLLIGCGGVGRALGFALTELGADLTLHDTDPARRDALRAALPSAQAARSLSLTGFDGVVNATPLGMAGQPGSPTSGLAGRPSWAFDAVYTPPDTRFRAEMAALGARTLSGEALYVHQGLQAFTLFSGLVPDAAWVRAQLWR